MSQTTQAAQQPAWAFEVTGEDGVAGTLTLHRGTGHWSNRFNRETGQIGAGVYVYEATFEATDGSAHDMVISRNDLLKVRRHEKRRAALAESEA